MGALKWKVLAGKSHSGHNCVLCVLWTHCDDSGVLFVFFPWATNIFFVFFYHVLNLLDWFASLATKTFSSKPFTLLLIIYKLVNFEEHNRQHIYEKNIKSSDQNKIQYLCGVETTFCGCALVQYRTNHRTWRDRTWTNSYNCAELDFDLFISPSVI